MVALTLVATGSWCQSCRSLFVVRCSLFAVRFGKKHLLQAYIGHTCLLVARLSLPNAPSFTNSRCQYNENLPESTWASTQWWWLRKRWMELLLDHKLMNAVGWSLAIICRCCAIATSIIESANWTWAQSAPCDYHHHHHVGRRLSRSSLNSRNNNNR